MEELHKAHRAPKAGAKATKKSDKKGKVERHNHRAFSVSNVARTKRNLQRNLDIAQRKEYVPQVNKNLELEGAGADPPPYMVVVMGPMGCGKSTLIRSLVKYYTRHSIGATKGPITVVTGKKRRITFFECPQDTCAMLDLAKVADLVILMVDASFGFEMETFEFLNMLQVHGFPKVVGVLTHLDHFSNPKSLQKSRKRLKARFWTEIYQGAKMFFLSTVRNGKYPKGEIQNLALHMSRIKFRPLQWRNTHPYVVADRREDATPLQLIADDPNCERDITLYGYVRGTHLKKGMMIHVPGAGDFALNDIIRLPDPCPLPGSGDGVTQQSLKKDAKLYAPMADVGGVLMDEDAMYIDIGGQVNYTKAPDLAPGAGPPYTAAANAGHDNDVGAPGGNVSLIRGLQGAQTGVDEMLERSKLRLFSGNSHVLARDFEEKDEEESYCGGSTSDEESDSASEEGPEMQAEGDNKGWRSDMLERAAERFMERQQHKGNLMEIVYGASAHPREESDSDEAGGLFRVKDGIASDPSRGGNTLGVFDSSKAQPESLVGSDLMLANIRDRFVTGNWEADKGARGAAAGGNAVGDNLVDNSSDEGSSSSSSSELYGDYEDLQTDEVYGPNGERSEATGVLLESGLSLEDQRRINAERKASGIRQPPGDESDASEAGMSRAGEGHGGEEDEEDPHMILARQMRLEQSELNRQEFSSDALGARAQFEGHRMGSYVRLKICGMPCEFVRQFSPHCPILVGGLPAHEGGMGLVRCRVKRHRWSPRILKSNDPLIFSVGWRRFQSMPVYAMEDPNQRHRFLKYTPEHMHCISVFYGPVCPPTTGVLAVQSIGGGRGQGFRVSLTGSVLELDAGMRIVKKLKLVGQPHKIHRKTAFVKGMFNSDVEAARFEGGAIKTVSGVRGQIKKAVQGGGGSFRATFEDKVLLSDIIFCRLWVPVEPKLYFNDITSLLGEWEGMRTTAMLRRERAIPVTVNKDSLYHPEAEERRAPRRFNPLPIPKSLSSALPFKSKPKLETARHQKRRGYLTGRAVVLEPGERRRVALMQALGTIRNQKVATRKVASAQRREERSKLVQRERGAFAELQGEEKKRKYRDMGQKKQVEVRRSGNS